MLEAYGDQLAAADRAAADADYQNAAAEQRSFAAATSGGEGLAGMAEADRSMPSGTADRTACPSRKLRLQPCTNANHDAAGPRPTPATPSSPRAQPAVRRLRGSGCRMQA